MYNVHIINAPKYSIPEEGGRKKLQIHVSQQVYETMLSVL